MSSQKPGYCIFKEEEIDLGSYRFAESSKTVLEKQIDPLYDYIASLLPRWLAPNLITLLGFIASTISGLLYVYYQPNFSGTSPRWVLLYGAIATLFYHLCDFVDGKQARRVGASSPLGELFDHGVDAVNTVWIFIGTAACSRLDPYSCLALFLMSTFLFYSSHLGVYQTGVRVDNNGVFGVLEMTLFLVGQQVLEGVIGQEAFDHLTLLGVIPVKKTMLAMVAVGMAFSLYTAIYVSLFFDHKLDPSLVGRKDLSSTGRLKRAVSYHISTLCYLLTALAPQGGYVAHSMLMLGTFGLHFSLMTLKLISYHTIKKPLAMLQPELAYPAVLLLNAYRPFCDQFTLLSVVLAAELVHTTWFCCGTVHDFAQRLGIRCFTLAKKAD